MGVISQPSTPKMPRTTRNISRQPTASTSKAKSDRDNRKKRLLTNSGRNYRNSMRKKLSANARLKAGRLA